MDDLRKLRIQRESFRLPRKGTGSGGSPAFVGQVASTGANLGAGKFAKVNRVDLTGTLATGSAATTTATGSTELVYQLQAFQTGDLVIAHSVDYRWVAERFPGSGTGSGGTGPLPSCFCTSIPATLTMTVCGTDCATDLFFSCTIEYQTAPGWANTGGLDLGSSIFMSTSSFYDSIGMGYFYYYLNCSENEFALYRIYESSTYGPGAYISGIVYAWFTGSSYNTCSASAITLSAGSDAFGDCCVVIFGGSASAPSCYTASGGLTTLNCGPGGGIGGGG